LWDGVIGTEEDDIKANNKKKYSKRDVVLTLSADG
jgi:hypothetical protein